MLISGPHLIDAHVHFYDCYDRDLFFDSALANFRRGARMLDIEPTPAGWLLFTETARDHYFRAFRDAADGEAPGRWSFRSTEEDSSLIASRDGQPILGLVAGRQIVTHEGLEVLALCCAAEFADGGSLAETVQAVRDAGAVAVLPWGFGKWWFKRGAVIARYLNSVEPGDVYIGDNGRRLGLAPSPRLFAAAEAKSIAVLPGSDSFPSSPQVHAVAGYGFAVDGVIDPARPAAELKRILTTLRGQPIRFGRLERADAFIANQVMAQARKGGIVKCR